jgi:hypothetical protein
MSAIVRFTCRQREWLRAVREHWIYGVAAVLLIRQ